MYFGTEEAMIMGDFLHAGNYHTTKYPYFFESG